MHKAIKWRTQNEPERNEAEGLACATTNNEPSLTQQQFTEDADLNVIARRFGITHPAQFPAEMDNLTYRDTTHDPDLREVLDLQRNALDHFRSLPAKLRNRFHNSLDELWAFVNDPENAEEAVRLGLLSTNTPEASAQSATTAASTSATPYTTPQGTHKSAPGNPEGPPNPQQTPSQKVSPST